MLHCCDIHPQPQGAPSVRHAKLVAGIDGGEFFQQVRIKVGVALQAFVGNGLQRTGGQATGQDAGGRHHHVIAATAGEQLGFQDFRRIEGIVAHVNTGLALKALQGFGGHVVGPAVEVDHFVLRLGRGGHGKEQLEHRNHDDHLTRGSGCRMRPRLHW
ncbi:hypothetical protein D3C84_879510 [compost metagenome]